MMISLKQLYYTQTKQKGQINREKERNIEKRNKNKIHLL